MVGNQAMKVPIYTAFFTKATRYEHEAERLVGSLDHFHLIHEVEGIADKGSWAANAQHTATHVLTKLRQWQPHNRPIVYVNADAYFHQLPTLLEAGFEGYDLAAHRLKSGQLANGTLWVNQTPKAHTTIEEYERLVKANPNEHDEQRWLDEAIKMHNPKVAQLPAEYLWIAKVNEGTEPPVIEHLQASRETSQSPLLPIRRRRVHKIEWGTSMMYDNDVYLVAGGPSLANFKWGKLAGKDTIAINKAIWNIPNPTHFITMDYSLTTKINLDEFRAFKVPKWFVVNFGSGHLEDRNGTIYCRKTNWVYRLQDFDCVIRSKWNKGFTLSFNDFRSGNSSGYAAIQLAICLGYRRIHLLGYDLQADGNKTHYHEGYGMALEKVNVNLANHAADLIEYIPSLVRMGVDFVSHSSVSPLNKIMGYQPLETL